LAPLGPGIAFINAAAKETSDMRKKTLVIQTDPKALAGQENSFFKKYDVHSADTNAEVMDIHHISRSDVIVVVMEGPDDRELKLLHEIKIRDSRERPIIAITNHNSIEIERAIATIGVFYHLLRPFDLGDLNDLIKAALHFWNKKFHGSALFTAHDQVVK
jgi:DNA-binding NtrC family response regulator